MTASIIYTLKYKFDAPDTIFGLPWSDVKYETWRVEHLAGIEEYQREYNIGPEGDETYEEPALSRRFSKRVRAETDNIHRRQLINELRTKAITFVWW